MSLPGAKTYPFQKGKPIVFVPGTRKDRVLLVAHYDTVWSGKRPQEVDIGMHGYVFYSKKKDAGIGADDRLGCAALWSMRKYGHSLLLLPDEEIGCQGSQHLVKNYKKILKGHSFMLQFDRKGSHDMAHYGYMNKEFHDYMGIFFPQYSLQRGSSTDIRHLMPAADIPGLNLSIGFRSEHTPTETGDMFDYMRTCVYTHQLLKQKEVKSFKGFTSTPTTYSTSTNTKATKPSSPVAYTNNGVQGWVKPPFRPDPKAEDTGKEGTEVVPGELVHTGNSVDGFDLVARRAKTLGPDSDGNVRVIFADRDDNAITSTKISTATDSLLKNNALRKLKEANNATVPMPCETCLSDISVELQYHRVCGDIDCGVCGSKLYTMPDKCRDDATKANTSELEKIGIGKNDVKDAKFTATKQKAVKKVNA